jgi:putative membrane protein
MRQTLWLLIFFAVLIWSGINPKDTYTWLLEVAPALIGLAILVGTRKTFPLTPLVYSLILVHAVILMIGGHYTYAEVPFGDLFGATRNNYDKLGHFAQGFIPALIAREVLIRHAVVNSKRWLNVIIVSICLAFSAFYELIEWWVALLSDEAAESFLGTQGYIWDTQSDMAFALLGAICALVFLASRHNKELRQLPGCESA